MATRRKHTITRYETAQLPRLGVRVTISCPTRPRRVWTVLESEGPAYRLGDSLTHNENVFQEDFLNDWTWRNGELNYYSRITGDGRIVLGFE